MQYAGRFVIAGRYRFVIIIIDKNRQMRARTACKTDLIDYVHVPFYTHKYCVEPNSLFSIQGQGQLHAQRRDIP